MSTSQPTPLSPFTTPPLLLFLAHTPTVYRYPILRRASVMLKLPKLYKKMGVHALEELADSMGLQARGGRGEHSPPGPNGEFDISNKGRIGASEVELVQRMIEGVEKLIDLEEAA